MPVPQLSPEARTTFATCLGDWYRQNARVLPWRGVQDPYRIWLSEIMLQQTRVNAVLEHYARFVQRFPTVVALALGSEDEVLTAWSGLGYYRRARMLHRAAKLLVHEHGGALPRTAQELRRLPGIGNYTSAAIASIAFGESIAVVDGNVERVLLRVLGMNETPGSAVAEALNGVAQSLVPLRDPGDHNQAMMELGATVCLPRSPRCEICPVFAICRTRGEHQTLTRTPMQSRRVAYGLATRKVRGSVMVEVLLQKRPPDASLMAGMLELPQLKTTDGGTGNAPDGVSFHLREEPLLRVRHAIVGTNYYVEVLAVKGRREVSKRAMRPADLEWVPARELVNRPLTGLARKVLQRLRLMKASGEEKSPDVPLLMARATRAATPNSA